MNERKRFEAALKEDRLDRVTRSVYADWLYEHGHDEEATEQRRMATEEWCASVKYMMDLVARFGKHTEYYVQGSVKHRAYREECDRLGVECDPGLLERENWYGERYLTTDELIQAATDYIDTEGMDFFIQVGYTNLLGS